jgi:hypothetical protein
MVRPRVALRFVPLLVVLLVAVFSGNCLVAGQNCIVVGQSVFGGIAESSATGGGSRWNASYLPDTNTLFAVAERVRLVLRCWQRTIRQHAGAGFECRRRSQVGHHMASESNLSTDCYRLRTDWPM